MIDLKAGLNLRNMVTDKRCAKISFFSLFRLILFSGYLEKEIKQDNIPILDLGDNPEAPSPPEMVEMEVRGETFFLMHCGSVINVEIRYNESTFFAHITDYNFIVFQNGFPFLDQHRKMRRRLERDQSQL